MIIASSTMIIVLAIICRIAIAIICHDCFCFHLLRVLRGSGGRRFLDLGSVNFRKVLEGSGGRICVVW